MNPFIVTILTIFSACFNLNIAMAESNTPPDTVKKIHLTADQFSGSGDNGISTYTGNIDVRQGKINLKGDLLETIHPEGKLSKVIITGSPATFIRQTEDGMDWVNGSANRIEYDLNTKSILFTEEAQVEQVGKHIIKGHKLTYDIINKTIQGESTPDGTKRISVTFSPSEDNTEKTSEGN